MEKIKPLQLYTGYRWDNLNKYAMEHEKYYTPEPEEFRLGFQCEVSIEKSHGQYEHSIDWYPITIGGKDRYSLLIEAEFHAKLKLDMNKFRVKYLDKLDIESLGFIQLPNILNVFKYKEPYNKNSSIKEEWEYWHIALMDNRKYPNTIIRNYHGFDDETVLFCGTMKNISELKILLKQLDIL